MPSSRLHEAPTDDEILIEATPSPPATPENQRRTRSKSKGKSTATTRAVVIVSPPPRPRRPSSRSETKRSKRSTSAVDETLRTGIDFSDSAKKPRSRQRSRLVDPEQETLSRFLMAPEKKPTPGPGPSTSASRRGLSARRTPAAASKAKTGTASDPISLLDSDGDSIGPTPIKRRPMPRTAIPKAHPLSRTTSGSSTKTVQQASNRDKTPSARGSSRQPRNRYATPPTEPQDDAPVIGSPEDWEKAFVRKSASRSPQNRKARILVDETGPSPRKPAESSVLVPETVVSRPLQQPNPFYEGAESSSRLGKQLSQSTSRRQQTLFGSMGANHSAGVGASVQDDFTIAPTGVAGPSQPLRSQKASASPTRPLASPIPASQQASSSKLPPTKTSSLTFGEEPTPPRVNLLSTLARSPSKSPVKRQLSPEPEEEVSPPQYQSIGARKRNAFLDDDESFRPAPRTKYGRQLLKQSRANQPPVTPLAVDRPQRVKSYPGKYTMPTVDTPIEKWPTTKGSADVRPSKKPKRKVLEEIRPSPTPPAESPPPPSQWSVMSSFLSPPPETLAPPGPLPNSQRSALSARSPLPQEQTLEPLASQNLLATPSKGVHRRLSQLSQQAASQVFSPRTPKREGTPSVAGSDFFSKFAEFAGTPEPEESQLQDSPSAQRIRLSPQASLRSVGGAPRESHVGITPQKSSQALAPAASSPMDLAARILAENEEAERRRREELAQEELERERKRQEMEALMEEDERDEEEIALNLSQVLITPTEPSPSRTPPPERRKSARTAAAKSKASDPVPHPSPPPQRPKKSAETIKAERAFGKLIKSGAANVEQQRQWELALANIAERAEARQAGNREDTGNALDLDLNDLDGLDQEALKQAREEEEVSRCEERARELESMLIFWDTEEEEREPRIEMPQDVAPLGNTGPEELPLELLNALCGLLRDKDMVMSLLSSGMFTTLSGTTAMHSAAWLIRLAFEFEEDVSVLASQQLLEVLMSGLHGQPIVEGVSPYQILESIWAGLGATDCDKLPLVDVQIGRQNACAFVCEMASAMATTGWLEIDDMNNIISHLIRLAIDPTTTPSLQRAIVESTNVLITTSLQGNSPVRLAMVLAADLAPLSLYHKSRAVLALGQGSEDLRAVVRLLAMGLLSPGSLESLSKDASGPSQELLEGALKHLIQLLMSKSVDWIDVASVVTLYVAAASDSAQFAHASANRATAKHSPFSLLLAQAQQLITTIEHHEPRAMIIKSRLNTIDSCGRYTSQMAWHTKEKNRLERHGLQPGAGGQTRLSLGTSQRA